ncbi:hypothetical protein BE221DRAFT_78796 [Ostreococcus tauri]|uniref:Uncharacterized protein n=1 Tax=Ostreococcus tauri TaxID=70448 RepID=A0A1Y5IA18_OSTTA|nr:hypothetical protein BE221DRAFT_78796 [Ostreococcus tauri]
MRSIVSTRVRSPIGASVARRRSRASPRAIGSDENDARALTKALENARKSKSNEFSPGAGLGLDAEAQAMSAFADMIDTSIGGDGALSDDEAAALATGGTMDAESTARRARGPLAEAFELFKALSKGAHIVQSDDGRTM